MNIQRSRGYTLIEVMAVLAITGILTASTVPLGAFWIERAQLAEGSGELTHSFGKAIATSLRNQHALAPDNAIAAICVSDTHQLTVLEAMAGAPANCATNTGQNIWNATLPEKLEITSNGIDVRCMCFNTNGFPTSVNCISCAQSTSLELSVGGRSETLYVH